jgi:hypothetical protein
MRAKANGEPEFLTDIWSPEACFLELYRDCRDLQSAESNKSAFSSTLLLIV